MAKTKEAPPADGERPVLTREHPVREGGGAYTLETPALSDLYEMVEAWLARHVPGAIVFGRQRLGKTSALLAVAAYLARTLQASGRVFVVLMEQMHPTRLSPMYGLLLGSMGHLDPTSNNEDAKRGRLRNFVKMICAELRAATPDRRPTFVLLIDEAQLCSYQHHGVLNDLFNWIYLEKVHPLFLLFGQEQLLNRKEQLRQQGWRSGYGLEVVGRYMLAEHRFRGVCSADELTQILREYDEADWPEGSGWSHTRYFFPELAANGGLAGIAPAMFVEFERIHTQASMQRRSIEIPMMCVAGAVEALCREHGYGGTSPTDRITAAILKAVVAQSFYAQWLNGVDVEPKGDGVGQDGRPQGEAGGSAPKTPNRRGRAGQVRRAA